MGIRGIGKLVVLQMNLLSVGRSGKGPGLKSVRENQALMAAN
jgi:hypothetical protein